MELGYGFTDLLLTSHAGLPAFSHLLKSARLRAAFGPSVKTIPDSAIFTTQIALLALGKTDFEAVSAYRDDPAFTQLLGLKRLPSAEILRQRLDGAPQDAPDRLHEANLSLLQAHAAPLANQLGFVPLDIDTTPMDNSGSHREGVSYTYKGFDGFHPLLAYLGEQGYWLAQELRPGSQHAQKDFIPFFKQTLAAARSLTDGRLLVRMDAAHDAEETLAACLDERADFLLRWNPRSQDAAEAWHALGEDKVHWASGPGYFTAVLDQQHPLSDGRSVRRLTLVTRKTAEREQLLLAPEYELEGYWTSLDLPVEEVMDLYQQHATCEQFHSELKSDIGLERFPSGKFATNRLVFSCAQIAFNVLRLLGERMKHNRPMLPKRLRELGQVRFRLRTVMQVLLYHAGALVTHARAAVLKLGRLTANSQWVMAVLQACPG
jgi:hypothetical protein